MSDETDPGRLQDEEIRNIVESVVSKRLSQLSVDLSSVQQRLINDGRQQDRLAQETAASMDAVQRVAAMVPGGYLVSDLLSVVQGG